MPLCAKFHQNRIIRCGVNNESTNSPGPFFSQFREFAAALFGPVHFLSVARPTVWNSLPDHLRDPAVDNCGI